MHNFNLDGQFGTTDYMASSEITGLRVVSR